jgi:hypothetical protein
MTPKQARALKRAIRELVAAEVEYSWRGAQMPEHQVGIIDVREATRDTVDALIKAFTTQQEKAL